MHTHNIGSISPLTRKPINRKIQRIIHTSDLKLHFCTKTILIRFSYWSYISMPQIFHFKIVKIYLEQLGYFMISFLIFNTCKHLKKKKKIMSMCLPSYLTMSSIYMQMLQTNMCLCECSMVFKVKFLHSLISYE